MIDAGYQYYLDRYFPEKGLKTSDVNEIVFQSEAVDFPRKLDCRCSRCTSAWVVKAIASRSITLLTNVDNYTVMLPGIASTFEHR